MQGNMKAEEEEAHHMRPWEQAGSLREALPGTWEQEGRSMRVAAEHNEERIRKPELQVDRLQASVRSILQMLEVLPVGMTCLRVSASCQQKER